MQPGRLSFQFLRERASGFVIVPIHLIGKNKYAHWNGSLENLTACWCSVAIASASSTVAIRSADPERIGLQRMQFISRRYFGSRKVSGLGPARVDSDHQLTGVN